MRTVQLGNHVEILSGFAFKSDRFNDEGRGLPLVRIRDVKPARSETYFDGAYDDRFLLSDGDLLVGMDGEFNCARWAGGRALLNQRVCRVRSASQEIDEQYLFWFLPQALKDIEDRSNFVTVKHLSAKQINEIEIPLPPLGEQKRVATLLDQADELRRKRHRAIDRINQLGQAIFHEMFGDFAANPMGWDTVRLGDVCDVGSSKRVFVEDFVDEGVPFYRGTEVGKLATGEVIEPDLFISPDHYAELIRHSGKPEVGDLLLPSICHDGRIWRVDDEKPFYFKDGRVLWIKKNDSMLDTEYLRNHLRNAFLRNYHSIASGTTFAELKIVNLKGLSILCPPLKKQQEFSERIRELEATRIGMVGSESAAILLFNSLQHRAFKGEL
jgi:type I restriction enzyme S subunit